MKSGINNQYDFFKKVCLDDKGMLCGIIDIIDSLNGLKDLILLNSGTTINNYETINNEYITNNYETTNNEYITNNEFVTNNFSTTNNDFITNNNEYITNNNQTINNCQVNSYPIISSCGGTNCNVRFVNNFVPNKHNYVVRYYQQRICDELLTLVNINGFAVVTSDRNKPKVKSTIESYSPQPKTIEGVAYSDLPVLKIPFGYIYPDGTKSSIIPKEYIDSKGKLHKPNSYWVGKINKSVSYN